LHDTTGTAALNRCRQKQEGILERVALRAKRSLSGSLAMANAADRNPFCAASPVRDHRGAEPTGVLEWIVAQEQFASRPATVAEREANATNERAKTALPAWQAGRSLLGSRNANWRR